MKKVNRNVLWTEIFINELVNAGIMHACISPGSRNTPLVYACVTNKKIKSFSIIDERSSGFFALGIAKSTKKPAILICTSGTAAAEFYPAIIEAYQSKVPLIICTADRPPSLLGTGANQTIVQHNLYRNHILWFKDAGLPKITSRNFWYIKNIARQAFIKSTIENKGPVHINFPFDEPLDPVSLTDDVTDNQILNSKNINIPISFANNLKESIDYKMLKYISEKIKRYKKRIIVVGFDNYSEDFFKACIRLSNHLKSPILSDSTSGFRTKGSFKKNILTHYDAYLKSESFTESHHPDLIIQFGRNFTSKTLTNFILGCSCEKLLVNKFGEWNNPNNKLSKVLACEPETFCNEMLSILKNEKSKSTRWLNDFLVIENTAKDIKNDLLNELKFPNEIKIVAELVKALPSGAKLVVSNSLPVRDLDLVLPITQKRITIYHNRGASGIDGIISTALGIAQVSKVKTYLLIGDLAFYYDLNSLLLAKKYPALLTIILINNNGGRIFETLHAAKMKEEIKNYFITPHYLDFKRIVTAFGLKHYHIKSLADFKEKLSTNIDFSVLELKTNSRKSFLLRKKYYKKVNEAYNQNSIKMA